MTVYSIGQARPSTILLLAISLLLICGSAFAQTRGIGGVVRLHDGGSVKLYDDYQALVIGVGGYEHWPKLPGAMGDAEDVASMLQGLGFKVKLVLDPDSAQLKRLLDELPYDLGYKQDRGLFIYFAGHGATETLADETKLGYVIPKDCPLPVEDPAGFAAKGISMEKFETLAKRVKSRHVLMAFDSCFSGSIFALGRDAPKRITKMVARPVRQFITAGNEEETVPDVSIFKQALLDGIRGDADRDHDEFVTGSELGYYLASEVSTVTRGAQHPQYGKIRNTKLNKGDFVFQLAGGPGTVPPGPDPLKKRIDQLLKEAEALFRRDNLTTPAGANALERYNQVLRLEPLNSRADAGKKRIVGKYVEWARSRYEAGNYSDAENYLSSAKKVSEHDERVWRLAEQIRKAKRDAAADERRKREELARRQAEEEEARRARLEAERQAKAQADSERRRKEAAGGPTFNNSIGMKFVRVPAGSFDMGSNSGDGDEKPVHGVTISRSFYLQATEVTQGQWRSVMGNNPSYFEGDDLPVESVSWNDVQKFIRKLNAREGGNKYRLPTEAEWEYAARAGSTGKYCFGDDEGRLGEYAWYKSNSGARSHPVGGKRANTWGLYDMHGNVWEWVQDWYGDYSSGSSTDPVGRSTGSNRVARGGGWHDTAGDCRSAYRGWYGPGYGGSGLGFRLARGH